MCREVGWRRPPEEGVSLGAWHLGKLAPLAGERGEGGECGECSSSAPPWLCPSDLRVCNRPVDKGLSTGALCGQSQGVFWGCEGQTRRFTD